MEPWRTFLPDLDDATLDRLNMSAAQWSVKRQYYWAREQKTPSPGDPAPDFELPLFDDPQRTVRLASFRGDRPVVLIFGSYT